MNPNLITSTSDTIDPIFMAYFGIALVLLLGVTVTMIWFVIRYHRSRNPQPTSQVASNLWLELVWTIVPTLLVLGMFYYGWAGYLALRNVPAGALAVTAEARMWAWSFIYPNGKTSNRLYVPVGQAVRVELVSRDVLHAFYIPAFRVKRDAVPGLSGYVWFVASKAGAYDIFCAEYCGVGHSAMTTSVEALPAADFAVWLATTAPGSVDRGRALLAEHGCLGCHSLDGSAGPGPTFKSIFGRAESVRRDGQVVGIVVDEAYLREAILHPEAAIVVGFDPIMPASADLKPEELAAILATLRGLP